MLHVSYRLLFVCRESRLCFLPGLMGDKSWHLDGQPIIRRVKHLVAIVNPLLAIVLLLCAITQEIRNARPVLPSLEIRGLDAWPNGRHTGSTRARADGRALVRQLRVTSWRFQPLLGHRCRSLLRMLGASLVPPRSIGRNPIADQRSTGPTRSTRFGSQATSPARYRSAFGPPPSGSWRRKS